MTAQQTAGKIEFNPQGNNLDHTSPVNYFPNNSYFLVRPLIRDGNAGTLFGSVLQTFAGNCDSGQVF